MAQYGTNPWKINVRSFRSLCCSTLFLPAHSRDKFSYDTAVTIVEAARSSQSGIKQLSKRAGLRRANPFFWKDKLLFKFHRRATLKIAELTDNALVKLRAYLLIAGLYVGGPSCKNTVVLLTAGSSLDPHSVTVPPLTANNSPLALLRRPSTRFGRLFVPTGPPRLSVVK